MTAPLSSVEVFEHVRDHLASETGRDCFLVQVPREDLSDRTPYMILYPIGILLRRDDAPLEDGPNPFTCNLQVTTVGRERRDAEWMISKAGEALETMPRLPGSSDADVRLNLGFREGPSEGVFSSIGRWLVRFAR